MLTMTLEADGLVAVGGEVGDAAGGAGCGAVDGETDAVNWEGDEVGGEEPDRGRVETGGISVEGASDE